MKKFLMILFLLSVISVFVSCASDEEEIAEGSKNEAADSGKAGEPDTAASDADTVTPADTDPADTSADPADSGSGGTTPCTPDCAGKQCGSDGCGGVCGMCGEGKTCNVGTFTCQCTKNCDGTTCGDDGCGGTCSCQNINDTCDQATKTCKCLPDCDGKECGEDGCGGKCGSCGAGLFCDNGKCAESKCGEKICGKDEAGIECGGCGSSERCSIDQTQCIACSCEGRECGYDGCGNLCGNGGCGDGQGCNAEGKCVTCDFSLCSGKVCGRIGSECNQECGTCNRGEYCSADQTSCSTKKCQDISISDFVHTTASDPKNRFFDYTAEYTPNGGSSKNHVSLTLYYPPYDYIDFSRIYFNSCTGEKPNNANNACAFIKEYTGELVTKLYFAQSGVMTITGGFDSNGSFYAPVDRQLVFVEVDMNTGELVPDGNCYIVTNNPIKAKAK